MRLVLGNKTHDQDKIQLQHKPQTKSTLLCPCRCQINRIENYTAKSRILRPVTILPTSWYRIVQSYNGHFVDTGRGN